MAQRNDVGKELYSYCMASYVAESPVLNHNLWSLGCTGFVRPDQDLNCSHFKRCTQLENGLYNCKGNEAHKGKYAQQDGGGDHLGE